MAFSPVSSNVNMIVYTVYTLRSDSKKHTKLNYLINSMPNPRNKILYFARVTHLIVFSEKKQHSIYGKIHSSTERTQIFMKNLNGKRVQKKDLPSVRLM